jgi:hypothetical protein
MAHSHDTKNAVRFAYVDELLALSVAAIKNSVAEGTARRWKMEAKVSGDDWDFARAANSRAAGPAGEFTNDFIEEFKVQINETFNLLKTDGAALTLDERTTILTSLTDMMSKVMKASGGNRKLEKRTIAAQVVKLLSQYIETHHPQSVKAFIPIIQGFGPKLNQELKD